MSDTKEEGTAAKEAPEETPAVESNGGADADAMEVDEEKKKEEEPAAEEAGEEAAKEEEKAEETAKEEEKAEETSKEEEKAEETVKEEEKAEETVKEEEKAEKNDSEEKEEGGKTEEGGEKDEDEAMDEDSEADADVEDGDGKATTTPKKRGAPSTPSSAPSSSKRQRKAPTFLEPKNFKTDKDGSQGLKIPKGRGTVFKDIDVIKENITKRKPKDPVLAELHKFLLGGPGGLLGKGRTPMKLIRPHVLEFSGYIPEELEGENDEEKQEAEDVFHARFNEKVDNLKLPLIKSFFDILGLKRGPTNGKVLKKDDLSAKLLEFLACPKAEECQKSPTKRRGRPPKSKEGVEDAGASPPPAKKRRGRPPKAKKEEEAPPEEEEEEIEVGKVPSDKMLKKWVKAYVTCFNLDKATANHAVQTASDKFEVDMDEKKGVIMEMLKDAMSK